VRFLIDECLHLSLVEVLAGAGHVAEHVVYRGMQGWQDHSLMKVVMADEAIFVTNNAADFLALHGREELHPGLVILLPTVTPARQRDLMRAVVAHFGVRYDLINRVIEVSVSADGVVIDEYDWPRPEE
jgi:predicted nuclease of predicted toxin-antitoxin system